MTRNISNAATIGLVLLQLFSISGCVSSSIEEITPTDLTVAQDAQAQDLTTSGRGDLQTFSQLQSVDATTTSETDAADISPLKHITDLEKLELQIKINRLLLARTNNRIERARIEGELNKLIAERDQLNAISTN